MSAKQHLLQGVLLYPFLTSIPTFFLKTPVNTALCDIFTKQCDKSENLPAQPAHIFVLSISIKFYNPAYFEKQGNYLAHPLCHLGKRGKEKWVVNSYKTGYKNNIR